MFRLSLKMTVARKGRLLLTSLAIILGTSFLSGTTIFSDTINSTFDRLFTDVFRDVDAYVRSTDSVDTGFGEVRASSPVAVLDKILNVKGVAAAVGDMQSYARVIAKDGKPLGEDQGPTQAIDAVLPADAKLETLTGAEITEETTSQIKKVLGFFTAFLTAFSYIALGIGCFVIYNVFSITAAQRQRESALLRAIGASRRQVTISLLVEALIVGVIGSVIGFVAGIGLSRALSVLLNAIGLEIPTAGLTIATDAITRTVLIGTIITILSAILPALRSGRVPPLAAMRETALDTVQKLTRRVAIGLVLIVAGAIALFAAMNGASVAILGVGVLGVFAGVLVIGPALSKPVAVVLGKPVAKLRGVTGAMSQQNAARNPKRTARTAAPVLIG
ncbi:MAG: FtsX-like permease family protein [Actinobacteria bacterium]|nr:FtsX-like permease family protein [Actinomycetota bacterium]